MVMDQCSIRVLVNFQEYLEENQYNFLHIIYIKCHILYTNRMHLFKTSYS
jgi:hypothetical protein